MRRDTCVFAVEDFESFFKLLHGLFIVLLGFGGFGVFGAFAQLAHHLSCLEVKDLNI